MAAAPSVSLPEAAAQSAATSMAPAGRAVLHAQRSTATLQEARQEDATEPLILTDPAATRAAVAAAAEAQRKKAEREYAERKKAEREKAERKQALRKKALKRAAAARKAKAASRSFGRLSAHAASVMSIASGLEGSSYARGGDGPTSFDCSGFTQYVFSRMGVSLPHSSSAQRAVARRIPASEVRPGDLVFVYNGGGGSIGHVAIYAGPGVWYEAQRYGRPVGRHGAWSSNVSYGRVL
jgi:cell wall-associated NlpC family hydrolase